MFLAMFVEVLGALFFFLTTLHIQKDKALVDLAIVGKLKNTNINLRQKLMFK